MTRQRLPNRRQSTRIEIEHNGARYPITFSRFSDGRLGEIFIDSPKPNSEIAAHMNDGAVLVSLLLQHGVSPSEIRRSISGPLSLALAMADQEVEP